MNHLLLSRDTTKSLCTGPRKSISTPVPTQSAGHTQKSSGVEIAWKYDRMTGRWLLESHARRLKGILKNHYTSEGFIQNKYNILISMGILISPNLRKLNKISVSNSINLFSPSTTTLPAILKSHRSETWRHTGMRTKPPVSLETPPSSWAATIDEKWL